MSWPEGGEGQKLQIGGQVYGLRFEQFAPMRRSWSRPRSMSSCVTVLPPFASSSRQWRRFPFSELLMIWSANASRVPWHILIAYDRDQSPCHRARRQAPGAPDRAASRRFAASQLPHGTTSPAVVLESGTTTQSEPRSLADAHAPAVVPRVAGFHGVMRL